MLSLQHNFPLSQVTTLKIGGEAKEYISVSTDREMKDAISYAKDNNLAYLVVGGCSNLLVSDQGYSGLIIRNQTTGIFTQGKLISAKSGTTLQLLVDFSVEHSLAGLHHLTGIPGSLGGAIFGNAGAYGQTISDHLLSVKCFDGIQPIVLKKDECGFGYRDSIFKKNHFTILEAEFELKSAHSKSLAQEEVEIRKKRLVRYPPGLACPGSFFKNILAQSLSEEILSKIPEDKIPYGKVNAGFLLESVGAKGERRGAIEVSSVHGNLFVNKGGGKAEDFYKLAKTLAEKVKEKYGVSLEPEVQLINLPSLL